MLVYDADYGEQESEDEYYIHNRSYEVLTVFGVFSDETGDTVSLHLADALGADEKLIITEHTEKEIFQFVGVYPNDKDAIEYLKKGYSAGDFSSFIEGLEDATDAFVYLNIEEV